MSDNLWPKDFGVITERTPVAILREQARGLGERTDNIVVGRVQTNGASSTEIFHQFSLYCGPLGFQMPFLVVSHGIDLYPATIAGYFGGGPAIPVNNEEEFTEHLKEIFSRATTKKLIASLVAQSKQ
jgi:hypothetical protein